MGGVRYVAFVIDCFSRAIVGWHASTVKDTTLVTTALKMALWRRDHGGHRVGPGLIHHSDAGSQGGFNWSSQHPDLGGMRHGYSRLEQEGQRCCKKHSSAVAC
ncbi:hypothetical protein BJI47_00200 [Rhodococcus sp. 1168]|nr:hypothetical protein BJI47_00200 [Rhodococcus sp. 1168]